MSVGSVGKPGTAAAGRGERTCDLGVQLLKTAHLSSWLLKCRSQLGLPPICFKLCVTFKLNSERVVFETEILPAYVACVLGNVNDKTIFDYIFVFGSSFFSPDCSFSN